MRILVINPFGGTEFRGRENLERVKRSDTSFEMVNIADVYPLKNNQFLYFRHMCTEHMPWGPGSRSSPSTTRTAGSSA